MIATIRRAGSGLLLLCLFVSVTAAPARAAAATLCDPITGRWFYTWSLEFTYDVDINGLFHTEVECHELGVVTYSASSDVVVVCATVGSAAIGAGRASFTGGHFECGLPDLHGIVLELTGGEGDLPAYDDYPDLFMQTVASPAASTPGNLAGNPLFAHPDATYYAPRYVDLGGRFRLRSRLSSGDVISPARRPPAASGATLLFQHHCPAGCHVEHWIDTRRIGSGPTSGPVLFATAPVTIYVGYSAVDGTTLAGWIDNLIVDPGNLIPIDPR